MDNELAIIPEFDGYNSQHPCTSEINERNPEIMVHIDAIGTKYNIEKNDASWISVPIVYEDNSVDNKKSSLRYWKRFLRSSNNKAATEVTPTLPSFSKRKSSEHGALDSHAYKKQLLSKEGLSILHTSGGANPSPPPTPLRF